MSQPYLSIIIPAYNEAERIPEALLDIDKRLSAAEFSYEILVVNDGSKDKTAEVVTGMTKLIKNMRLIDLAENKGKGGAVREGMAAAKGVVYLFSDADNSTSIDQFENMIPLFKEGYSLVIASRAAKGAKLEPPEPWYRGLIGKGLNLMVQALILPGFWDTQCGFKAFTAEAAQKIFPETRINSWGFDVEIISIAKRMGYKIKEIPVRWVDDKRTHVKFAAGIDFITDTLRVRWWLWTKKYSFLKKGEKQGQNQG